MHRKASSHSFHTLSFVLSLFAICSRVIFFLVTSGVFLFFPISFAFGPVLLSCLLCSFPLSSVSSFLSPSPSFPFHFFLLALSSFAVFVFLLPRFLLSFSSPSCCFFSLPLGCLSYLPLPTLLCSSSSIFGFLLLFFSFSLFLPLFYLVFLSYCFSTFSLLLFFLLVLWFFLFFVFFSSVDSFFLSFSDHFIASSFA